MRAIRHPDGDSHASSPFRIFRPGLLALALVICAVVLAGCASFFDDGAGNFNTVIVDAGHGGHDRGGRSVAGSPEKVHALDIANRVAAGLRRAGFRVIMTRDRDAFIPLGTRTAISNRTPNSIFVSIHLNWARRRTAAGLETYYHSSQSRRLAANIQREITRTYRTTNRGVKRANFYVLRQNRRPAVLIELGFLSNPYEARLMEKASHRQRLADAIVRGIIEERRGRSVR